MTERQLLFKSYKNYLCKECDDLKINKNNILEEFKLDLDVCNDKLYSIKDFKNYIFNNEDLVKEYFDDDNFDSYRKMKNTKVEITPQLVEQFKITVSNYFFNEYDLELEKEKINFDHEYLLADNCSYLDLEALVKDYNLENNVELSSDAKSYNVDIDCYLDLYHLKLNIYLNGELMDSLKFVSAEKLNTYLETSTFYTLTKINNISTLITYLNELE